MARWAIQRGEVRRIVEANVVIDFRQQHAAKALRQRVQTRVFRAARLAETLNFFVNGALAGADFIALNNGFALALQQLLQVFGDVLA